MSKIAKATNSIKKQRVDIARRMLDAMVAALKIGVHAWVQPTGDTFCIFFCESRENLDEKLSYDSTLEDVVRVESELDRVREKFMKRQSRAAVAQTAWATLDEYQRSALKEFINHLV